MENGGTMNNDQAAITALINRGRAALERTERALAHLHAVLHEAATLAQSLHGDGGVVIYDGTDKPPPGPPGP
jgi:hypothetical protein